MAPPSTTIDVVMKEMLGVQESDENLHILNVKTIEFRRVEEHLGHMRKNFQDQQNKFPEPLEKCLETLKDSVEEAKLLINRAKQRPGLFSCCFGSSNPDLSPDKARWKRNFYDIYQQLQSLSVVAAETGVEESAQPPKLKSEQTDRQMAKSARSPEMKGDHTQQTAESTGPREPKSDRTRQAAVSARSPEVKSDHSRQIAESARPPELKSDHTRRIVEPARPPDVKYDASA